MNPAAFKASVEARLRKLVDEHRGRSINRVRTLLVMERFVDRVSRVLPDSALLKGGLALELRLDRPRTTKDVDFRLLGDPADLDRHLREIAALRPDPEDHLEFRITPDRHHPTLQGDGVKYDGQRFQVRASLAGRPYAVFGLDLAYGDPILGAPEILLGTRFFERYGIAPVQVRTYPVTSHLAEKLHAYTLPRERVNSRVKDLVDMPLIGTLLDGKGGGQVREAFELTFGFRASHPLPSTLPPPPEEWLGPYDRLRREEALPWETLADLHEASAMLVDPVLAGTAVTWSNARWKWVSSLEDR